MISPNKQYQMSVRNRKLVNVVGRPTKVLEKIDDLGKKKMTAAKKRYLDKLAFVLASLFLGYAVATYNDFQDHPVRGTCDERLLEVKQVFQNMLRYAGGGLSLTIMHKGNMLCNLYGGLKTRLHPFTSWENDTMAVGYSTTKVWAGLAAAMLASQGYLDYDKKMKEVWPAFKLHGKEEITVRDMLDHKAGLITFGDDFTLEDARNVKKMQTMIEQATPHWTPGKHVGYHALTYGFLIDHLFTNIDYKNRTAHKVINEEFLQDATDYHLGLPSSKCPKVATIFNPSIVESVVSHTKNYNRFMEIIANIYKYGNMGEMAATYPSFMNVMVNQGLDDSSNMALYNNCTLLGLPCLSSMGVGTTSGFVKAIQSVFDSGKISDEMWEKISEPCEVVKDIVLGEERAIGHGFFYSQHPVLDEKWNVRIIGNGMQMIDFNRKDEIIIALLRNGLQAGTYSLDQLDKISHLTYNLLLKHEVQNN